MNKIKNAFQHYLLMRRITVFLTTLIAGYATWAVYNNLDLANASVASIYATTMGLMGTVVAFYMKHRNEESQGDIRHDRTDKRNDS